MEMLLAIGIMVLAAGGLAVGLVLTGRPPETSCEGMSCVGGARCEGCPKRREAEAEAHHG